MTAVVERTEEATLFSQGSTLSSSFDEQESEGSIGMIRATTSRESDQRSSEFDEKKEENESDQEEVFCDSFDLDGANGKQESGQSSHEEEDKTVQSLSSLPPPTNANDVVSSDRHSKMNDFVKNPLHMIDTWDEITKRDKPLSNETLVHVMDHSMAMLGERLCEANREFRDSLKAFEHKLGRFRNLEIELGKRIASGSFADIYRVSAFRDFGSAHPACTELQAKAAQMVKQDKPDEYVVKVLRKSLLLSKKFFATGAADFITEGTLLASFDHPHILSIRGRSASGVEGFSTGKRDCIFLVLERMNGDLTHKLQEWKRRSSQHGLFAKGRRNHNIGLLCERLELMSDLAGAMAYLHERNVIHRDVALGNVGISFSGKAKLLDFGLAKVLPPSHIENERFLLTGKTGSVRYMAPEIGLKQPYNLRADVYSFTILLYEVLTLEKAFSNWQSNEIFEKVHHKNHRPRMYMFWSQRLKELFRCCWSHNPDDRLPMNYVQAVLQKEMRELEQTTTMDLI